MQTTRSSPTRKPSPPSKSGSTDNADISTKKSSPSAPSQRSGGPAHASSKKAASGPSPNPIDQEITHGPSSLPPLRYPGYGSPWKPKKGRDYLRDMKPEDHDRLDQRMGRIEQAAAQYLEQRREKALENSLLRGLDKPSG